MKAEGHSSQPHCIHQTLESKSSKTSQCNAVYHFLNKNSASICLPAVRLPTCKMKKCCTSSFIKRRLLSLSWGLTSLKQYSLEERRQPLVSVWSVSPPDSYVNRNLS